MRKIFLVLGFIAISVAQSFSHANAQVDTAWVRRYDGPANGEEMARAIAVDGSGNVYVTGYSEGIGSDRDYATVKYSPGGDELWVRRYNGTGNGWDEACAIVIDGLGNVCVTGNSPGSSTETDWVTIRYNLNGDTLWVRRYGSPYHDFAHAIAVDGLGNVYVTGNAVDTLGGYTTDVTIKYGSNGNILWERRYGRWGQVGNAIVADGYDNVYVTGSVYGGSSDNMSNYLTIKYTPDGDSLWARTYDGPASGTAGSTDITKAIAVDGSGNVYVTGFSQRDTVGVAMYDYTTIKYGPDGNTLWVRRYEYGEGCGWEGQDATVAVDGSGNVYVTGTNRVEGNFDYITIKYSPEGDELWVRRYNGTGNGFDFACDLALDGEGNVYVTGASSDSTHQGNSVTVKYSPYGDILWVHRYLGPGDHGCVAAAVAVDGLGSVYVTGTALNGGGDYLTIKYVQIPLVDTTVEVSDLMPDSSIQTSFGDFGDWGKGSYNNAPGDAMTNKFSLLEDVGVLSIDSPPDTIWTDSTYPLLATVKNHGDITETFDVNCKVEFLGQVDPFNIYKITVVTLLDTDTNPDNDTLTKLIASMVEVGIEEATPSMPSSYGLVQNYPNPFIQSTTIKYLLPAKTKVSLKIYDITGKLVKTLANEEKEAGNYNVRFDAKGFSAGIYFARFVAGDCKSTKKLILVR